MGQLPDPAGAAVLVKVVETGSFRGAARALGMPKSSVSRRVAELEDHLKVRLLQRTTRRVALTDAGRVYFDRAAAAVLGLEDAERAARDLQVEPQGALRLTAPVNFGLLMLPQLLADFLLAHPKVRVEVELSDRHVDLIEERFDVAIRAGALRDSSLVAHRLSSAQQRVVASPAYLRKRKRPEVPADLREHACLIYGAAESATWGFVEDGRPVSVEVKGPLCANNHVVLCDAAAAGLGVARVPGIVSERALAEKRLCPLLEAFAPPEVALNVVYPSARYLPPRVRAFVGFVRERLAPGARLHER
jgi:DNA-binding transcriptional LysR family regulator